MKIDLNIKRIIMGFLLLFISKSIFIDFLPYGYGINGIVILFCFGISILMIVTGLYPKNKQFEIKL